MSSSIFASKFNIVPVVMQIYTQNAFELPLTQCYPLILTQTLRANKVLGVFSVNRNEGETNKGVTKIFLKNI